MRWTGFVVAPLLSSFMALGVEGAPASRGLPVLLQSVHPGTPPVALQTHPTTPPDYEVPSALKWRVPAAVPDSMPQTILDHRLDAPRPQPSPVPNTPRKELGNRPSSRTPARVHTGGEDVGTATPIPSLPYMDTGNTCSFLDDYTPTCGAPGGPDVVYAYVPQADGCIQANLCSSSYDTELFIAEDTPGNVIACNDDYCGLGSQLNGVPVSSGHTYYIIVDGFAVSCGDYVLTVDACPPPPGPVYCPPEATPEGEPVCGPEYLDEYDGGCASPVEAFIDLPCSTDSSKVCGEYGTYVYQGINYRDTDWYRFSIGNTTTLHFCVTGQYETSIFVIDGRSGCGGAFVLYFNAGNPGQTVCLDPVLPGGTYYLVVATTNFSGVPCGSNYYMTFVADSCPAPPPPPECPPNAMQEGEPVCYDEYVDQYDAGCNSFPETYVDLPCSTGTVAVCGTYGTYLYQGLQYRDTDWYRIVVNRTSSIQYCVAGEYATAMYVLDGRAGCSGITVICGQEGFPNQPLCCDVVLSPGTYYLFVATSQFVGPPCGGLYVMSVTRDSCPPPLEIECPPGARQEGEPVCHDDYVDQYDAGCNSNPPTFVSPYGGGTGNRDCIPGTVQVCGTYGTYYYQGLQYRDTDWYEIVLDRPTHLRYCAVGEAPTVIALLDGTGGCAGLGFVCSNFANAGDSICCDVTVDAGTYWLFVSTSQFSGVPCGSRYVISVTRDSCPQPIRVQCPPGAIAEGEPTCSDLYVDATNGGCNSDPPVFTEVRCAPDPIQICGTYGTYEDQGIGFRDTDWYAIDLIDPAHLRFCVIGEAPTVAYILRAGDCNAITFEASASGAAGDSVCCEADLPAGMHWLFVSTTGFSGIPCGSHYVATLYGHDCGGVTAAAVGGVQASVEHGAVEVRWQASLDVGTEFRVLRAGSAEGAYEPASPVIRSAGEREFRFVDRACRPATEYFYRIAYRQGGGDWATAGTARVVSPAGALAIHAIVPNPSSAGTRIDYELPRDALMRLEIYDVAGHRIRLLSNRQITPAGVGSAFWDGRSDRGLVQPAGAYYVRLTLDSKVVTRRLTLVR